MRLSTRNLWNERKLEVADAIFDESCHTNQLPSGNQSAPILCTNSASVSANQSDSRRLVKYASFPDPIQRPTAPSLPPCLRSFTTSTGCGASLTYNRAFTPLTSTLIFVHSPGPKFTYGLYCPGVSLRSLDHSYSA
jgi:hypothetical protein